MSIFGYAFGFDVLVVGVDDDPIDKYDDGSPVQRVYIGSRWRNHYCIPVQEDAQRIRRAWDGAFMGHLTIPQPPSGSVYCDEPQPQEAPNAS